MMTSVSNMEFHESHSLFTLYHVMACYQCLKFRVGCLNTFAYALAVLIYGEPSLKAAGLSGFVLWMDKVGKGGKGGGKVSSHQRG